MSKTRRKMVRVTPSSTLGPPWVLTKLKLPVMVLRGVGVGLMT